MSTSTRSIESVDRQFFNRFSNQQIVDLQHPHTTHSVAATSYAGSTYGGDPAPRGSSRRSISPGAGSDRSRRSSRGSSPPNRHNAKSLHRNPRGAATSAAAAAISAAANASVFGAALKAVRSSKDMSDTSRIEEMEERRRSSPVMSPRESRRSSIRSRLSGVSGGSGGENTRTRRRSVRRRPSRRRSHRRSRRSSSSRRSSRVGPDTCCDDDKRSDVSSSRHDDNDFFKKYSDSSDQRREKQSYFIELQELAKSGIQLSRPYTMDDSLEDMQHEVYMHNIHADTKAMVGFMKFVTQIGATGLEVLNAKIGPIVDLDGWSKELTGDMSKFDRPFTRIYRRLFKRGSMNPYMELAYIVLGSLVVHVMRKKLGPIADMLPMFSAMMPGQSTRNVGAGVDGGDGGGGGGGGGGMFNMFVPGGGAVAGGMPTTPLSAFTNQPQQRQTGYNPKDPPRSNVNSAASEPPFGSSANMRSRAPTSHVTGQPRVPLRRPPPNTVSSLSSIATALGQNSQEFMNGQSKDAAAFAATGGVPIVGGSGAAVVCDGDVCELR